MNISPKELKFLMYFDDPPQNIPLINNYKSDITFLVSHQFFIENSYQKLKFYTFVHFTTGNCNKPTKQILNIFNKSTQQWNRKLENHRKFDTFNACPIIVNEHFGPFMYLRRQNEEIFKCIRNRHRNCIPLISYYAYKYKIHGFTYDIFKIASKLANFTPIFRFHGERLSDLRQAHYEATQVPKIQILTGPVLSELNSNVFVTSLILDGHYLLAATPTEYYNNYEKLLLPFDDVTWTLLVLTFVAAFSVIFVVKFLPKRVRYLVLGRETLHPALNVLHSLFGVPQFRLPSASIPRFILVAFVFFCLIFRTCYQSKLFEFMASDMRKLPPKTVKNLIERNYTIVSCGEGHLSALYEIIKDKNHR
jgi:hypothetical protein